MSIRSRLRSSSNSTEKVADDELDDVMGHFGQCNLCGQRSIKQGNLLLTCTVCATQYHPACLDLKSEAFKNANYKVFKWWNCRKCRRCLFCRKKKIKDKLQSPRSNRANVRNEMISCKDCDSSIHVNCFYTLLQQRQGNKSSSVLKLSSREIRNQKANFRCNTCLGTENFENDDESEEEEDEFDEESMTDDLVSELSELTEIESETDDKVNTQKLITLRSRLKHLGVENIEEHLLSTNDSANVRMTRSNKRLTSSQPSKCEENGGDSKQTTSEPIHRKSRKSESAKSSPVRVESKQNAPSSSPPKAFKLDHSDSEDEKAHCTKKRRTTVNKKPKRPETVERIQKPESEDDQQLEQENVGCSVNGCDSRGHLSGALDSHRMLDTCPLFHNQTIEKCVERFRKRMEANKKVELTPRSKARLRLSTVNKKNIKHADKLPSWATVMNQRETELAEKSPNKQSEEFQSITTSRQPDLSKFAPSFDLELFLEAQSRTAELIHKNSLLELMPDEAKKSAKKSVQSIELGRFEIGVWYSSPYSSEFQNSLKLFICEYCLKCMNSSLILQRHFTKCTHTQPPGKEIYRKDSISFFEIDGNKDKDYCQNLCLLAKLFLDYKTLFFDVEPFLFYVMTEADSKGKHVIGYFSKEKYSVNNYNVSCILTLPHYQRHGYGRMLIDFSYLLTRTENKVGSPEKPLSDLGLISYRSYWKFIIMDYLSTFEGENISLKNMSQQTGINSNDIVSTLQLMELLKYWKGKHIILRSEEIQNKFALEVQKRKKLYANKMIDPKFLTWTPTVYPKK